MAKQKETRPILLQEENAELIEFKCGDIEFIQVNFETEFVPARDREIRKEFKKIIEVLDSGKINVENKAEIKYDANGNPIATIEGTLRGLNLFDMIDTCAIIACCSKRKGEKWSLEQHKENIQMFDEMGFESREKGEKIIANFTVSLTKSMGSVSQILSAFQDKKQ